MKLGCSTVIFNQLDLYGALQHIAWAGYQGAELAYLGNYARHVELNTTKTYTDEVKATAKKHGVELLGIHAGFGDQPGEDRITSMRKMFDVASKLGIPIVTIRCKGKSGDKAETKEEFKYIRALAKEAESRGVKVAVKPHVGASVYNTASLIQMMEEIDSPGLGACLDTLHIYRAGEDSAAAVRKLGDKIVHVHLRDYPKHPDLIHYEAAPEEEIPGKGDVDFPKTLKSLKAIGYTGGMSLDIIGAFTYPLSRQMGMAAETRGYINRCLQELK